MNEENGLPTEDREKAIQLYDEVAVAEFLESLLSFSPDSLDKDFTDIFIHQIIQQGDDHFVEFAVADHPCSEKALVIHKKPRKSDRLI